jgi:hypothetical protein
MRWHDRELRAIDRWRHQQPDAFTRPQAIRRLIEMALTGFGSTKQRGPRATARASEMASAQIDQIADPSATAAERERRKRRLVRGPKEFRDLRRNQPSSK